MYTLTVLTLDGIPLRISPVEIDRTYKCSDTQRFILSTNNGALYQELVPAFRVLRRLLLHSL